jgi:hypothetical protein
MRRAKQAASRGGSLSVERAIARLEDEAGQWERNANELRDLVQAMREKLRAGARLAGSRRGAPAAATNGRRTRGRRGRPGTGAVAAEILRQRGKPMRAGEILPELEKRGVHVGGASPLATLASTLHKYPGVRRVARGLFAPAGAGAAPRGRQRKSGRAGARGGEAAGEKPATAGA